MEPIATAKTDGTHLLLYFEETPENQTAGMIEGWWFSSPKEIDDGWETIIGFIGVPSHWMPLPARPGQQSFTVTVKGDCGLTHPSIEDWQKCPTCRRHLDEALKRPTAWVSRL